MLPLNIEEIRQLFSMGLLLKFILAGLLNAVMMIAISYKFLQIIQQTGYNGNEYFKWLFRKDNAYFNRLLMLSLLSVLGFLLVNMALSFIDKSWVAYSGFLVYIFFLIIYFKGELKRKEKLPLVITKRMIRLIISYFILTILFSVLLVILVNIVAIPFRENILSNFRYGVLCFCPIFVPYLILLAYYINNPLEKLIISKYIKNCKEKLTSYNNLIKVGITGSYGKTTVKEILKTILSEKYKVVATPLSYNTPLGISKTVKRLDGTEDVFIAEMGARRVGDIKELTQIVNPQIAVITGVTNQHLSSFLTAENIKKTKFELVENMQDGKAVFSSDNIQTKEMKKECKVFSVLAGISKGGNPKVYADDIVCDENGTTFTLHIKKESVKCQTALMGKHNVSNICLAVAVADMLGLTMAEISSGISRIKPIKHRLELIKSPNGINILDDSYNANPEGFKCALEVLNGFKNKKYVVTPGIVELGFQENEINFNIGTQLSKVADGVILVGRARALRIREGLLSCGYPTEKIKMVSNLEGAKEELKSILKDGDVVLFANDLPDKYL